MSDKIYHALTGIGDDFVEEAQHTKLMAKQSQWKRFGALAAMLVLVIGIGSRVMPLMGDMSTAGSSDGDAGVGMVSMDEIPEDRGMGGETIEDGAISERAVEEITTEGASMGTSTALAQVLSEDESVSLVLELVSWQSEGFSAIVLDTKESESFPLGAKLTVIFEDETEILLADGTVFSYTADEPNAEDIFWETGVTVLVDYVNYEAYEEGNGFYNRLYAQKVSLAD